MSSFCQDLKALNNTIIESQMKIAHEQGTTNKSWGILVTTRESVQTHSLWGIYRSRRRNNRFFRYTTTTRFVLLKVYNQRLKQVINNGRASGFDLITSKILKIYRKILQNYDLYTQYYIWLIARQRFKNKSATSNAVFNTPYYIVLQSNLL